LIPDDQTTTVYVSDLLVERHPQIEHHLRAALGSRLRIIPGTKDIWCRDYMPVQTEAGRFVQFRYRPDYLEGYPELRTENGATLLNLPNWTRSELVIDGGNVVHGRNVAIITDKIYEANPGVDRLRLRETLKAVLEIDRLVVIPKEPYDRIGHADGMVRFVNEKVLLVNDYSSFDPAFGKRLAAALRGFELISMPYCPTAEVNDGIASAEGVYINFVWTAGILLLPRFGRGEDDLAAGVISRALPTVKIVPCNANDISRKGGVLNCSAWNILTLNS
jgi:agmatine deiminase